MRISLRLMVVLIVSTSTLLAQKPFISPAVVPAPGEIYTYKFIKNPLAIDTTTIGENILWDFSKVKDTATYYEEVYRESTPSQNEIFEDSYSVDSNSIRSEQAIWVNYLDSTKYYRLGAFEKPTVFESEIPYIYDDTMMLFTFPFQYGETLKDRYAFIKNGRRHHKNQYVQVTIKFDGYGTVILPNNDTCHQAIRIRREEKFHHIVNDAHQQVGTKVYFYWYSAVKQNYFIRVTYANGKPIDAWYQKKRALIKKKRNYD
jgi:hypothetical protein